MTQLLQKNVFGCDYTFQLPCVTKEPSGNALCIQYMVVFFHTAHHILYECSHFPTAPLHSFPGYYSAGFFPAFNLLVFLFRLIFCWLIFRRLLF